MRKIVRFLVMVGLSIMLSFLVFFRMTNPKLLIKIGGFSMLRVETGSMEKELLIGDIIIIKECDEYEVNDIVTYNVKGEYLVTHRIVEKSEGGYKTKGDNNNGIDHEVVSKEDIEGKVIYCSKLLRVG